MNFNLIQFQLTSKWVDDVTEEKKNCCNWHTPGHHYVIDEATGNKYLNEPKNVIKAKCLLLAVATPVIHLAASVVTVALRIGALVTLSHFWLPKSSNKDLCGTKLNRAKIDLVLIATQIVALISLEFAAIYGIFRPLDGRKLYGSLEMAQYGRAILAPCFQPSKEKNLDGSP